MIKDELNLEILGQHLLLSNTPIYLFKHFKSEESIKILNKLSVEELAKQYNEYYVKKDLIFEDMIIIYAIIVSFSLRSIDLAKDFFNLVDVKNLRWGKIFQDIILTNPLSENFTTINLHNKFPNKQLINSNTSSINSMINISKLNSSKE